MKKLWQRIVRWFRSFFVEPPKKFKLTAQTVGELEIYGGIRWDDEVLVQQLNLCANWDERDELLKRTKLEREFVEIESNRDKMMQYFAIMKPDQIAAIEDKVNRGEKLYATDPTIYLNYNRPVTKELEY